MVKKVEHQHGDDYVYTITLRILLALCIILTRLDMILFCAILNRIYFNVYLRIERQVMADIVYVESGETTTPDSSSASTTMC